MPKGIRVFRATACVPAASCPDNEEMLALAASRDERDDGLFVLASRRGLGVFDLASVNVGAIS